MSDSQAYRVFTPDDADQDDKQYLVIAPQSVRLEHSERGVLQEIFCPQGVEMNLECYACPNPECNCPDDYYMSISVQISKAEYDRIRAGAGWYEKDTSRAEDGDDDD